MSYKFIFLGDRDPAFKLIADTSKLIGNCVYGHTSMNKEKHKDVKFCDFEDAKRLVNDPFFREIDEIDEDYFEVG